MFVEAYLKHNWSKTLTEFGKETKKAEQTLFYMNKQLEYRLDRTDFSV